MIKIGILGCGPAGLLAAHAAALAGFSPAVLSKKAPSYIGGAQYMHGPIPFVTPTEAEGEVSFHMMGTEEGYAEKVYGQGANLPGTTSFTEFDDNPVRPAWDLRAMYRRLWSLYENRVIDVGALTPSGLNEIVDSGDFDLVVSTIPLKALCWTGQPIEEPVFHWFHEQKVLVSPKPLHGEADNVIVYDGTDERSWYRSSRVFGEGGTEWSTHVARPPLPGLAEVSKPIRTNCDCWPDVIKLGRYGQWSKGVLVHHAFLEMALALRHRFEATVPGVDYAEAAP